MLGRKERIHCIGIGGAGMFPMAEILHRWGYPVSGSDSCESIVVTQLREWGIPVQIGHEPDLVNTADIVVYSSAVSADNPELIQASKNGALIMKRAVLLGDLMRKSFSIAVAGTHGKTTTTSLIASILATAGKSPTVVVGGLFCGTDTVSGAMIGDGKVMVCEADEYDRSFLQMYPSVAVVTNIEADHLDIYRDLDDIRETFAAFIHRVPFYGEAVLCIDDAGVRSILPMIDKPVVSYGFSSDADFTLKNVCVQNGITTFTLIARGEVLGEITVPLIGKHNIQNTLAAIAVAIDMQIPFSHIALGARQFPGVKRRMEVVGRVAGITVIDDYAHHPTEVQMTLQALCNGGFKRIIAVFQPHLYSRTRDFASEFSAALTTGADMVYLLPIYPAREQAIEGVSSEMIADFPDFVGKCLAHKDDLIESYIEDSCEGDVVVLMGAGDVWTLGEHLMERLGR